MQLPDNISQLLDETPYGRVTIDLHRVNGVTMETKIHAKRQHKTQTVEQAGAAIGNALNEIASRKLSGRLEVQITFERGILKFTYIEILDS